MDAPILDTKPGTFYSFLTSNPTPVIHEDGSVLMIFKSRCLASETNPSRVARSPDSSKTSHNAAAGCNPAILTMLDHDCGVDTATDVELAGQTHEAWLAGFDQVIEDHVGDLLVEMALFAERPHVELE